MTYLEIHNKAVTCVKNYKRSEADLLEIMQEVDAAKVYRHFDKTSLHSYAVDVLGLSDNEAYQFSRVARKAVEIPELKESIKRGELNVSTARRIVGVITPETSQEWIDKAKNLKQKALEREVVKVNPRAALPDRIKPITETLSELRVVIPERLRKLVERVQDIECQRTKATKGLVDALEAACVEYLRKNDPLEKAKRNADRPVKQAKKSFASRTIPAQVSHQVVKRDEGRCTYRDSNGRRCQNRRWLEMHHIRPVAAGGRHDVENLRLLCWHHHTQTHAIGGESRLMTSSPAGRTQSSISAPPVELSSLRAS